MNEDEVRLIEPAEPDANVSPALAQLTTPLCTSMGPWTVIFAAIIATLPPDPDSPSYVSFPLLFIRPLGVMLKLFVTWMSMGRALFVVLLA